MKRAWDVIEDWYCGAPIWLTRAIEFVPAMCVLAFVVAILPYAMVLNAYDRTSFGRAKTARRALEKMAE